MSQQVNLLQQVTRGGYVLMQNDIISDADIEKITGYKIPSKQCHCLKQAGIFFVVRRDGRPRTTWQHFNDPITHRKVAEQENHEPNFGALD